MTSASGQARVGVCEDDVWMCVEGVHKCTGLGKKKRKNRKKKTKTKKRKEKKEMRTHCKPIHQLHGTGSLMLAVSCGLKGMVGCVPTTGCVQKPWGGLASDACNVGASGHHCQDLMMAW